MSHRRRACEDLSISGVSMKDNIHMHIVAVKFSLLPP